MSTDVRKVFNWKVKSINNEILPELVLRTTRKLHNIMILMDGLRTIQNKDQNARQHSSLSQQILKKKTVIKLDILVPDFCTAVTIEKLIY